MGEPNSGKSNILDAIGFLSAPGHDPSHFSELARVKRFSEIYRFKEVEKPVVIATNLGGVVGVYREFLPFSFVEGSEAIAFVGRDMVNTVVDGLKSAFESMRGIKDEDRVIGRINANLLDMRLIAKVYTFVDERNNYFRQFPHFDSFRKYVFDESIFNGGGTSVLPVDYLYPPKGENLLDVIEMYSQIVELVVPVFSQMGFSVVVDYDERKLKIARFGPGNAVVLLPFYMVADTIQRLLFYYSVIISNRDAVIVLEEPEAHLFPFYIDSLAFEMLSSESNQFFISTHNPYFIKALIREAKDLGDVAIFVTYFEDYETRIRKLSEEELREIFEEGIDILPNLERYIYGKRKI